MAAQQISLGDTIYFWYATNDSSGSGADGATHVWDVRLAGALSTDAPVLSGSGTILSHANYPNGCIEVEIDATSGNGFAISSTYSVFATCAISTQNPTGLIGSFQTETPGSVTAHFTDRTTDGNSTVQTLDGYYTIHTSGTFGTGVLTIRGGATGDDPTTFSTLRTFVEGAAPINIRYSGDVRFVLASSNGSTNITAIVQEIP